MDYKTISLSRKQIRMLAKVTREIFKDCISKDGLFFDVIKCLELMQIKLKKLGNITYEICDDYELPKNVPAECYFEGGYDFHIKIKESVYEGAYEGIGGYRMHIMHEIAHVILFIIGCKPLVASREINNKINTYESMEWQAKALAGEVLIDYNITKNMSYNEIMLKCGVSESAAFYRMKL